MGSAIKVLHLVSGIGPQSFGLGPVVINYAKEQNLLGCDSDIWSFDSPETLRNIARQENTTESRMKRFPLLGPKSLSFSPAMEWAALTAAGGYEIVHQHGLWTGVSRVSRLIRFRHATPTVITPHGYLERWALQRSKRKKALARFLFEGRNLRDAACLHACSPREIDGFREFGLRNPVAVIPNGIGSSWLESSGSGSAFRERFRIPGSKRILLYLSRITPVKGIPMLIEALGAERRLLSDWVLVVAGADEFGHLKAVREAIAAHGLQDHVVFTGLLQDQVKRDAFAAAELFVLPTHHEASPVVVPEALGAGVPVITTRGAPWEELVGHACGWWSEITPGSLAAALREAMEKSPADLGSMGERGRALVASKYTWRQAARMMTDVYGWMLRGGTAPSCVKMD